MKTIAVINTLGSREELINRPFNGGSSALERVQDFTEALKGVDKTVVLKGDNLPFKKLLEQIAQHAKGYDMVLYCFGDCPLYDRKITEEMLKSHTKYFAEYSFADGYPQGLAPEIISTSILPPLSQLAEEDTMTQRGSFFETLLKDINSFDIETRISPKDYRYLRLQLTCDSEQNFLVTENLAGEVNEDREEILENLENYKSLFRGMPNHYSFQIYQGSNQNPQYELYYKKNPHLLDSTRQISLDEWKKIVAQIHSWTPFGVISFSLWGEPALHPQIGAMMAEVLHYPGLELVLETNGTLWKEAFIRDFYQQNDTSRLKWIIHLDAVDPQVYREIRGEGLEKALSFCQLMLDLAKENFHIQVTRLKEYEAYLEPFYRGWKEKTENIIVQKYNHYSNRLPDRRVTDLSPLVRRSCWHLKRELHILADGSVYPCSDSFDGELLLGNIFNQGLQELWKEGEAYYHQHLENNLPPLCKDCDEYYTFNF